MDASCCAKPSSRTTDQQQEIVLTNGNRSRLTLNLNFTEARTLPTAAAVAQDITDFKYMQGWSIARRSTSQSD
jgi:hypothetical protein